MTRTGLFLGFAALLAAVALIPLDAPAPAHPAGAPPTRPVAVLPPAPSRVNPSAVSDTGAVSLHAKLGATVVPAGVRSELFARLELLATLESPKRARGAVSLGVVLDRSGSMAGSKLEQAKRAVTTLIDQLQDGDLLTVAHYGTDVQTLPPVVIGPQTRESLKDRVLAIRDDGGTNLGAGLEAGRRALRGLGGEFTARRLILISDGQPTEGVTDSRELVGQAGRIREEGIAVSALGIGLDFNDALMRDLANHGGGFYADPARAEALAGIFQRELGQAVNAVAQQVEVRLSPVGGVRVKEVFGFPHRREGAEVIVQVYDLSVAQTARVLVELDVPADFAGPRVLTATLGYRRPRSEERTSSAVVLEAASSGDAAVVEGSRDAEVHADSLRVIGGRKIAEATRAYERGDREAARSIFGNVRALFGASAQALSGDIAAVARAERELESSQDPEAVRARSMAVRKNLSNFGVNNAY